MTKLKSKKMSKSTFAVIIMAIAMVAMIAFGGTYAYFTAAATTTAKTAKFGEVVLTADGEITAEFATTNAVPGDSIFKGNVGFKNESTVKTVVIANFVVTYSGLVWDADGDATGTDFEDFIKKTGTPATAVEPTMVNGTDDTAGYFFEVVDMPIDSSVLGGYTVDTVWNKVTTTGVNAYVYGTEEAGYGVAAWDGSSAVTAVNLFKDENAEDEIQGANVVLATSIDRHYLNGIYQGSETSLPDRLVWEGATIEMSISFDQIQYDNLEGIGLTYSEAGLINEDVNTIYAKINAELHPVEP